MTVKLAAAAVPNLTAVAPVKAVPVITTVVPPAVGPADGDTPVTVGADRKVNSSAADVGDVWVPLPTVMSTVPGLSAGDTAVICVADTNWNDAAAVEPKSTTVIASRLLPLMVTVVPPNWVPEVGLIDEMVGSLV